jgi:hypothetical protein
VGTEHEKENKQTPKQFSFLNTIFLNFFIFPPSSKSLDAFFLGLLESLINFIDCIKWMNFKNYLPFTTQFQTQSLNAFKA